MPQIKLTNVTKRWGKFFGVDKLNLVIDDNSFVTLLGPSGCGKTTTLRMIAGLETPTSGKIEIGDTVVFDSEKGINIPANKRKVGFLFQNYALWPNMTVYKNIAFGLSNISEELPVYDFEAKTADQITQILRGSVELVELINGCKGKDGKIDEEKVLLKIIDTFTVSMFTAKKIFAMKLQNEEFPSEKANSLCKEYEAKIKTIEENYKQKGISLNDDFALVQNGKMLTKTRKLTSEEIDLAVRRVSRVVKIGMFMDRYPAELSGGQQQRVAIARTLAPEPSVLFMDEPLSNLDAKLRLEMRYELQRLHIETGSTFVYVTHDQLEAMTLATRICLINKGVLQQYDKPLTVYSNPANLFVADFVGNPSINFIKCEAIKSSKKNELTLSFLDVKARFIAHNDIALKGNSVILGIRPEFLPISKDGAIKGLAYSTLPSGMETTVKINLHDEILSAVQFGLIDYPVDSEINFNITGDQIVLFDGEDGNNIGVGEVKIL